MLIMPLCSSCPYNPVSSPIKLPPFWDNPEKKCGQNQRPLSASDKVSFGIRNGDGNPHGQGQLHDANFTSV